MTTTLVPSSGTGVAFTNQGQGLTPGYSALDLRRSDSLGLQEGVYNSTDFMVQQRIAGANMQVEITMTSGGFATVQGDTIAGQGLYTVPVHSANILETIGLADPTNPRVDQVILEVLDNVHDGSGGNRAQTRVVPGTASVGATLANRTGAAALPASALLLADVLVGAAVGSITNAVIRDRRKFARGAYRHIVFSGANPSTTSAGSVDVDATNLTARLETAGNPVRVTLHGTVVNISAGASVSTAAGVDGSVSPASADAIGNVDASASVYRYAGFTAIVVPAAGSHVFRPMWRTSAGTATMNASASTPVVWIVEEIVRPNAVNNSVTSG